ncbi:hypothetical protein ACKWTF_016800 [Chironomus riparius]
MIRLLSIFQNSDPSEDGSHESVAVEMNKTMSHMNESVCEIKIAYKYKENIVEHFESTAIREQLCNSKGVLFIRFEITEDFNGLSSSKINQISHKCIKKSVLLCFESKNAQRCFIYWKLKNIHHFLNFDFCEQNFGENVVGFNDFVMNFIKDSLMKGHLGLHQYYAKHSKIIKVQPNYFGDMRNYSLLLLAAEAGNTQFVKKLLNLEISSTSSDNAINAQELAWKGQLFDTLLVFLESNMTYPSSFDATKCPEEIKEFYKISLDFHKAIYSKNEEKIIEIINKNPTLCHFYNYSNESAPRIALNCKYIDVYRLLLSHKIFLGRHETLDETWENFSKSERTILREIHFKHSIYLPEKYLNDLTTNSSVAHDDPNVKAKRDLIKYAFDVLNANPFTQIILMIVAASKNFQILFDFCRNSVHLLDPTANFKMKGLFYSSGRIYISAWLLMFQSTENQAFGTLAHELCHFAMKLVFKNKAKPYYRADRKAKERFENISSICFNKSGMEPIIDLVFGEYPEKQEHAELIVRVPHLLALYHDQPEKLNDVRLNFIELFEFYEQTVVPEIHKRLPRIEA